MGQLGQYADIVIYDSPPAATVTDAAIVAQHVDAVLQVVLAGGTRIDLVQRCKMVLEQVGAHMLGPVLNRVGGSDLGYYAYYYSYGYYGHSNGNGNGNGNGQRRSRRSGLGRLLPGRKRSGYRKDVPAAPVEPVEKSE
jgi:Mrp family chromosome partitioning ATPase